MIGRSHGDLGRRTTVDVAECGQQSTDDRRLLITLDVRLRVQNILGAENRTFPLLRNSSLQATGTQPITCALLEKEDKGILSCS